MIKPVTTVHVIPRLPNALKRLPELAYNMRWAWDQETITLFRRIDPDLWESTGHNPVGLLGKVSQERLEALCNDSSFMAHLDRACLGFDQYMNAQNTWYNEQYGKQNIKPYFAYFSMEFGINECLQNYSGGLGILSGDHLKSASDLGLPLVGVGLLYQEGYFQQYLNADGWQQELYPLNDYANLPVILQRDKEGKPLRLTVPLPGRQLYAQIWKVQVGRVSLLLLDSNIPENRLTEDRNLTDRLYGGDRRIRIRQEILLGIGGIRALEALGLHPDVCHMNEGHSAFLLLERIRLLMHEKGVTFNQAKEIVAASTVFTIHTNVPAGLERFGFDLIDEHFTDYMRELGLNRDQFIDLGRESMGSYELFSMSDMALKLSSGANGVAKLHGVVAQEMWQRVYPGVPKFEVPIGSVTNGVHVQTWVSREMGTLFDRYLDPQWRSQEERSEVWDQVDNIPDAELWRTHERRRERLVAFARRRLREQMLRRGAPRTEIAAADEVLNPDALTIGFARRFATYKRATLVFQDIERLAAMLNSPEHPVQIIFAGKAHPHDMEGKTFIREIVNTARHENLRHSLVFIENYDINVARYLVQGVDVWLNNPRRPKEASGTSGMKVIYNGGLNCSILDGWWDEAYTPEVGWAIGNGEEYSEAEADHQDYLEVQALYNMLEKDIIPLFYKRGRDGLPREWIGKVKYALKTLGPYFSTRRMVQQYMREYYMPTFERHVDMTRPTLDNAMAFADWRTNMARSWRGISILNVNVPDIQVAIGSQVEITATVKLGNLRPEDVLVQLYCGGLDTAGNIYNGDATNMSVAESKADSVYIFKAVHTYSETGDQGISVRVVPHHKYMHTNFQPGFITWA